MAFLLNNNNKSRVISSAFRLQSQKGENWRGFHVEPAAREKALLADDPSLRRFKSHKQNVRLLKRAGDVLTVIVVAGCCYEIYVKAAMREQARKVEKTAF